MTGRSHNVAAQATTLGKRFATVADEMLVALGRLDDLLARYPLRGIKGPMGTSQDMLDLLDGSTAKLAELEQRVARHLGFERVLTSVGQVYPRSLDFDVVSALVQLVAGPSNLATTIRLMAGIELVTEGFKEGQVGSSAMPHKMNTRSCERVNGLAVVLRGQLSMVGELAGDQWNEGDVSCSVVRRVALPDAFFATDGLFQTFLTVLDEFGVFPAVVQRELDRYLPFLTTTKVLMAAVRNGVGREEAHEAIKEHAVAVALEMRQGRAVNDLLERFAADGGSGWTARRSSPWSPTRSSSPVRRATRSRPSYAASRPCWPPIPWPRRTCPATSSDGRGPNAASDQACRRRVVPGLCVASRRLGQVRGRLGSASARPRSRRQPGRIQDGALNLPSVTCPGAAPIGRPFSVDPQDEQAGAGSGPGRVGRRPGSVLPGLHAHRGRSARGARLGPQRARRHRPRSRRGARRRGARDPRVVYSPVPRSAGRSVRPRMPR